MRTIIAIAGLLFFNTLVAQVNHEKLFYELKFGFIKGGELIFQTIEYQKNNKNEVYTFLHGYTTGFANALYAVDDRFESYINKEQLLPIKASKKLKEQKFRFEEELTFYHDEGHVYSGRSGWHEVKSGICDVSSLMFYLRFSGILDHLQPSQIIEIPFWDTNSWYMLKFKFTGIEKISTRFGKIDCLRLEPQQLAGRFFNRQNPMNIWVTNDKRRWPILMELNFTIGSVTCELVTAS